MHHRTAAGLALAMTALGFGCAPAPPEPTSAATLTGAGGCSARGCHGGPTTDEHSGQPLAKWSNAYSFWLRHDKHATAHRVLHDAAAAGIITRLRTGQPAGNWKDAADEPRCLACHVTPQAALHGEAVLRLEGVSCDACHTVPGRSTAEWADAHQRARASGWQDSDYARHGMKRLDTPVRRAETCTGCHVGAPADEAAGIPIREVTHDLIAAGHPRLNFEYLTYLALMPPHWAEPARPPAYPAHAWIAGQAETARAGLALSADRARRAAANEAVAWPELADWNCYSCHHDLTPGPRNDWRSRRANAAAPGHPEWTGAGLSDPFLRLLSIEPDLATDYRQLQKRAVRTTRAGADDLASAITRFQSRLAAIAAEEQFDPQAADAGQRLLNAFRLRERARDGSLGSLTWDEAAQTYYALRAINHCGRSEKPTPDEADQILDRIASMLRFPRNPAVNSPLDYDPSQASREFASFCLAFARRVEGKER